MGERSRVAAEPPKVADEMVGAIMLWLHRAVKSTSPEHGRIADECQVSIVAYERKLLPPECFEDTRCEIETWQLCSKSFAQLASPVSPQDVDNCHKVLVRGVASRADFLMDMLDSILLPDVRANRLVALQFLVTSEPRNTKSTPIKEKYTLRVRHDDVGPAMDHVVASSVSSELSSSLCHLQQALQKLPELDDVRYGIFRISRAPGDNASTPRWRASEQDDTTWAAGLKREMKFPTIRISNRAQASGPTSMEMDYVGVWPPEDVSDLEAIPTPTPVSARTNGNDFLDAPNMAMTQDTFICSADRARHLDLQAVLAQSSQPPGMVDTQVRYRDSYATDFQTQKVGEEVLTEELTEHATGANVKRQRISAKPFTPKQRRTVPLDSARRRFTRSQTRAAKGDESEIVQMGPMQCSKDWRTPARMAAMKKAANR